MAGVKVDLIVRDSCRLRPGIAGLSDNVRVISVVGRFLEHCRIYYFHNGGEEEYFIGSADIMKRNLEERVEVITPVEPPELRVQLRRFLEFQLGDQRSAWEMQPDGSYVQRSGEDQVSCHEKLIRQAEKRLSDAQQQVKLRRKKIIKRKKSLVKK